MFSPLSNYSSSCHSTKSTLSKLNDSIEEKDGALSSSSTCSSSDITNEAKYYENSFHLNNKPSVTPARRLALSRLVGHRHRVTQREQTCQLSKDIERLQRCITQAELLLDDFHCDEIPQRTEELYEFSNATAELLHCHTTTGVAALVLLELLALRRNLFVDASNVIALECPSEQMIEQVLQGKNFGTLRSVLTLHENWANYEVTLFYDDDKQIQQKHCTRCGKSRTAGSGHPRSTCDDGIKVGSMIQYQGGGGAGGADGTQQ